MHNQTAWTSSAWHVDSYQDRVRAWVTACFGEDIANDRRERGHRFIEEALELVQSCELSKEDVLALVEYVYSRPVGDKLQEVGGAQLTLAALCAAQGINLSDCAEMELGRVWSKIDKIREKRKNKPVHSPLPQ